MSEGEGAAAPDAAAGSARRRGRNSVNGTSSGVRPCTRQDLGEVVALYQQVMRGGNDAPPGLRPCFERTLFDHPWADPGIPSLVYHHDGRIVAFLASHVRRFVLAGEHLRLGCAGQFVSDPEMQKRGVGAVLLRKYLAGQQDLTLTDGATEPVARMWTRLAGRQVALHSLSWTRIFRPVSALRRTLPQRRWDGLMRASADALLVRLAGRYLKVPRPETVDEELTSDAVVMALPAVVKHCDFYPDYDRPFLDWLFTELSAIESRGLLTKRLVRAPRGDVLGWFVAFLPQGGIGQVVQVAAVEDAGEAVLEHLLYRAQQAGVAAIQGRVEPALVAGVTRRGHLLQNTFPALVHSRRPDVLAAIFEGRALLTRLEGESWMSHHRDAFQ